MRRVLDHPSAPVLAAALVGLLCLRLAPATADMAAHVYRTGLWTREGVSVWDAQWYGGHHVLGYSLLFSPLAASFGPRLVGVVAGVAAVGLFGRVARDRQGAVPATWLFAGGVMSNVVIGRMPFMLGAALAVAAWACVELAGNHRARLGGAGVLALAATWASPVAGAFLVLAAAARRLGDGRRERAAAAALALPVLAGGLVLLVLFPEGGPDRFTATAFWPMLAVSLAGAALLDPRRRVVAAGALLYLATLVGAFVVPTTFGQNALRLGVALGPPLLVLARRPRIPGLALAGVLLALLYLQWLPAVRAVAEARGDPATHASFQAEALRFLDRRARPGERVEVPLTLNHWEAAYLAPSLPLARGWQRQLDAKANPVFYDGQPLTPARYYAWLRDRGVGWVALPESPLDYSALAEKRLLERPPSYLRLVHRSPRWRIWRVQSTDPPVEGAGRMTRERPDGFDLVARRAGTVLVRQRWTRYWTVVGGDACLRQAGAWTAIDVRRAGPVGVRARFSPARAIGQGAPCADLPVPVAPLG